MGTVYCGILVQVCKTTYLAILTNMDLMYLKIALRKEMKKQTYFNIDIDYPFNHLICNLFDNPLKHLVNLRR